MQNGRLIKSLSLAVSLALLGGCGPASTASLDAALAAQVAELPDGRYQVDARRGRVWFLTHEGVFLYELSRPERVAIALPGWISAGPTFGCPPDLALGPQGEAVVTSNVVPTVWKIDPHTLVASAHPLALDAEQDKDIGFTGLVYSPQHRGFLAASYAPGMLWRIDGGLGRAEKVALSAPIQEACGLAVRPRTPWPMDTAWLQLGGQGAK
jgi:hypothetical protein